MSWTKEEIVKAGKLIEERAGIDMQFRELCKQDFHTAIKLVSGKEAPRSFKVNVVDNTGYHISVVLPPLKKAEDELSESELESVAGGKSSGEDIGWGFLEEALTTVLVG